MNIVPVDYRENLTNAEQKEIRHDKGDLGEW